MLSFVITTPCKRKSLLDRENKTYQNERSMGDEGDKVSVD